ncbi:hypothetical protein VK90_05125 [Bacillus sp. LK2]|nr:hypothetical protein VK90_05125 [Bacillus sp. LK2]
MLASIAYTIERECSIQIHQNELHLIHRTLDVIDSDKQVVICNQFSQHKWSGNIRELLNILERIYILSQGREICEKQISFLLQTMMGKQKQLELQAENKEEHTLNFREKIQCDSMIEALQKTNGNVSLAAKLLDVPRSTFYKRMQKFRL